MQTEQLILQLAAELQPATAMRRRAFGWPRLAIVTTLASAVTLAIILLLFSRSPHLQHGPSATIVFSALAGMALAVVAFRAMLRLSYPDGGTGLRSLLLAPAILLGGLVLETLNSPDANWAVRFWGDTSAACFGCVTFLSLPILAAVLYALRDSAPTRPWLSGALAGLLAGGITATLYTLHCPEDSLLFVATWHVLAIFTVSISGALIARRLLRW